jgi:hypothetical protein
MKAAEAKRACPHERIQHCPLYVESHNVRGLGCVDDMEGPCRVERGEMKYAAAVARVRAIDPRLIAQCEWSESNAVRSEQRARNMRLAGIH